MASVCSENQIVNMNDVYEVYGEETGLVNTAACEFFDKAIAFCEKYSGDYDIIKIGDTGSNLLFYEMEAELRKLQNGIKNYCEDRRNAFQEIATQERKDYNKYMQCLGDWSSNTQS